MPELPEVQTTVNGLNQTVKGKKIVDVQTNYNSPHYVGRDDIKNPKFFALFRKKVKGTKILKAERRAKNILIHLSNRQTILVHMKMTGHFVYNRPATTFVRLDFKLNNGKHLVLSDLRKFAKVTLVKTDELEKSFHLEHLGPEPLDKNFKFPNFNFQIQKKPRRKIKQVLMDQSLISGIGNIYSDEILCLIIATSRERKVISRTIIKLTKKLAVNAAGRIAGVSSNASLSARVAPTSVLRIKNYSSNCISYIKSYPQFTTIYRYKLY